jgi:hypothetical protein
MPDRQAQYHELLDAMAHLQNSAKWPMEAKFLTGAIALLQSALNVGCGRLSMEPRGPSLPTAVSRAMATTVSDAVALERHTR